MITKAIVKGIPNVDSNKYRVYIPLLRNANDSEADATLEATLCFLNGIYYSLAVDDVVYVDFEDNYYEKLASFLHPESFPMVMPSMRRRRSMLPAIPVLPPTRKC